MCTVLHSLPLTGTLMRLLHALLGTKYYCKIKSYLGFVGSAFKEIKEKTNTTDYKIRKQTKSYCALNQDLLRFTHSQISPNWIPGLGLVLYYNNPRYRNVLVCLCSNTVQITKWFSDMCMIIT